MYLRASVSATDHFVMYARVIIGFFVISLKALVVIGPVEPSTISSGCGPPADTVSRQVVSDKSFKSRKGSGPPTHPT